MAIKLCEKNLGSLSSNIRSPAYNRREVGQQILHVGVGGFHRAHQAVYTDDLLHLEPNSSWGICGVGLLKQDARIGEILASQDYLYTVVEQSSEGNTARVIGSILNFLHGPSDREGLLERMASDDCRIVSLTITEGGYYVHQGTGQFDAQNPDIQHDLSHPEEPVCSFGYLGEALDRRRKRGLPPFTIMSCDNLQSNGDVMRKMFLAFTELREPGLRNWLEQNGAFPNSMVDRITPATTDAHRALVQKEFEIEDGWPVVTEPFKQWVIEDHFPLGRPQWERVGAQMTSDVLPYEKMKIRLLNASHQALCYIGMLLGYQFAHETMGDARIRRLVETMMNVEVTPLLPKVPGVDLSEYKATLIERFANPAIGDQLPRIGTEGSARIPKFVLPSITEQLQRGGPIKFLSFTVAAWFRYLIGKDDQGKEMPIIDPMADKLRATAAFKDPHKFLAMREVFSEELANSERFIKEVTEPFESFYQNGAKATLERWLELEK